LTTIIFAADVNYPPAKTSCFLLNVTRHKDLPERNQSFADFRQTAEESRLTRIEEWPSCFGSRQGFASTLVQTAKFCGNAISTCSA
jgi:hypothetical protein